MDSLDELASIPNAECGMDALIAREPPPLDEAPLSRFERLAIRLGAWAGGVAERWAFSSGPFFAFDGRLAAQYDDRRPQDCRPQDCQPATPEACPSA